MSISKETLIFVVILNLVLSAGVVTAGLAIYSPESSTASPAGPEGARVAQLEEQVTKLRQRVDGMEEMESAIAALKMRIADYETRLEALPSEGATAAIPKITLPFGAAASESGGKTPTAEERMAKGMAMMMKNGMRKARDRFLKELMDESERGERRAQRQVDRAVEMVAGLLKLDARDTAEVSRILTEVDTARRAKFRTLLTENPDPDDIKFEEIKVILDDSFAEEDRMIASSLSPEKAEEYQKTAEPMRSFFYGAAQMAFSDMTEEK